MGSRILRSLLTAGMLVLTALVVLSLFGCGEESETLIAAPVESEEAPEPP